MAHALSTATSQEDMGAFLKKEGTPEAALEKLQRLLR
jgi:hypothetical protein